MPLPLKAPIVALVIVISSAKKSVVASLEVKVNESVEASEVLPSVTPVAVIVIVGLVSSTSVIVMVTD